MTGLETGGPVQLDLNGLPTQPSTEELISELIEKEWLTVPDPGGVGEYNLRYDPGSPYPVAVYWRSGTNAKTRSFIELYVGKSFSPKARSKATWSSNPRGYAEAILNAIACGRKLYKMDCCFVITSTQFNESGP